MSGDEHSDASRRTVLRLAALAGLPLGASEVGSAATTGHLGETWSGSDNLTIDVSGFNQGALNVQSEKGFGFKSYLSSTSDTTGISIYGATASTSGEGVRGEATNADGEGVGVLGSANSPTGYGVYSEGDLHVDGDLTATGTKNFVQTVDTDDGPKEVAYTAVESDRAQTETTGVAELDGGRAVIDLPDHFGLVTSGEEDLVVQLTPYAVDVPGLAVTERSTDRVVVESRDGSGDFEFSYTVRGVREGYEDDEVVTDGDETRPEGLTHE